jgi:vacuolar-type H+-ATPase subunit E/Vma4
MAVHGGDATMTVEEALQPVRQALLQAAKSDVDSWRRQAEHEAAATLAAAHAQAERIGAEARAQGQDDARRALDARRAAANRAARGAVLAARREVYEALQAATRTAVSAIRSDADYPAVLERLASQIRRLLGSAVRIHEAPGGGLVGTVPGRRVDLSADRFGERAVDVVFGGEQE